MTLSCCKQGLWRVAPPTTPVTSDLAEVLVFSMVDMRRAKASTTRLPEPVESSLAVVNSYSSGSTPETGTEQAYSQTQRTRAPLPCRPQGPSDPSCWRGHKHHNTALSWGLEGGPAGASTRRRLHREAGRERDAGRRQGVKDGVLRTGRAPCHQQHILNSKHHIAEGSAMQLTWDRGGAAGARVLNGAKEIQV